MIVHANNGEALLEIVQREIPSIVFCDIRKPKMDGITVPKLLQNKYPEIQVIAFTMFNKEEAIRQMLEIGAIGYILKIIPYK